MISMLPSKGANNVPVKTNIDKPKIPADATKDESKSFLNFSRENLSISHSDLEQGFNKIRPRVRRDTILSLVAIFLALFCVGLEIWKIQSVVDNGREIEVLKREVESMKHRLLEEDLLDELKAFEEQMYAEEDSEDDDVDDAGIDDGDYDSVYDDDDINDEDEDDDSILSSQEYPGGYRTAPYTTHTSGSGDAASLKREDGVDDVLAALHKAEEKRGREFEKSVRENRKTIERERFFDNKEKRSRSEEPEDQESEEEQEEEEGAGISYGDSQSSKIIRKRSVDEEKPLGYNPSGVPIYAQSYLLRNRKNFTRNSANPGLTLYDGLTSAEKVTTEKSQDESSVHHAIITSWDKYPPKKYYAQSRPATSHVTPPASYSSRIHNSRQIDNRRSGDWRDEGPQALRRRKTVVNRKEGKISKVARNVAEGKSRSLRRRGMSGRRSADLRSKSDQMVAAHYGGNSNRLSSDDHHVGNGKVRHSEKIFKAWNPSNWMSNPSMNGNFTLSSNGELKIHEQGLYLIYVQIHYVDMHDENGFQVLVNGISIMQCMDYSPGEAHKSRSCFSSRITPLCKDDLVLIKDVAPGRYSLFHEDKSFFGLVKLGDAPREYCDN